jgi:hypothetical protein
MSDVNLTVTMDDRLLTVHIDKLPDLLRQALLPVISGLTNELLAQVHSLEPRRTGALISNTRAFVDQGENFVRGRVRVLANAGDAFNIAAAALEYGAHRAVDVRSYRRRSGAVRGYTRRANIRAHNFLRGPEAAIQQRAKAEITEAVIKAMQGTTAPTR